MQCSGYWLQSMLNSSPARTLAENGSQLPNAKITFARREVEALPSSRSMKAGFESSSMDPLSKIRVP